VRVFDAFVRPGPIYALLEPLLVGPTLEVELARVGRFRPSVARRILLEVLEGLEAIHRAGLVHREVSSENVIVGREAGEPPSEERAILVDLGLALPHGEGPTPGHIRCTPKSVSPEQILSGRLDARTDVYAAGALLHELLTGAPPFAEKSVSATFAAHLERLPALPGASDPALRVFDGVIDTALAKRPDRRYASAAEFARALGALELEPDVLSSPSVARPRHEARAERSVHQVVTRASELRA
jgi:eukaryotic-like serine/threonine-protein kinase